ncbi:MAG: HAD family hydrolase, partial [Ktedonobacterales bacterium]
ELTYSSPRFLEMSARGVDKATTLARLCQRLGVAPAEVVAFGDMPNDVAMLRWAGVGVAVANAHPEALAAASAITTTNMEDGVALALERLLGL